jgi:carboxylate-amine ligase
VELQLELTTCQVETTTWVVRTSDELAGEVSRLRGIAAEAAQSSNARLLAVALPPAVPHEFPITDTPRYRQIADRFGMIAHEQGICGCHVHVEVPDRETAVQVSNRLLLAPSANSAIYRNTDTGYARWRSILWARWPSAGPPPHFKSADDYDATVQMMLDAGAMLDEGMVYWDVRPSANFRPLRIPNDAHRFMAEDVAGIHKRAECFVKVQILSADIADMRRLAEGGVAVEHNGA